MSDVLQIKGRTFGEGKPLVCVPVMDAKAEDIVAEVKCLIEQGIEVVEWRVDAFAEVDSPNAVRDVLERLRPYVENSILLFTFRSKEQGGECALPQEKIIELHLLAAESQVVDLVDVEYFEIDNVIEEIVRLQGMGVKVVSSHHNFHETPSAEVMSDLLRQMLDGNPDIVKLAVMPQHPEDVLCLLQETLRFHQEYPNQALITMSMGKMGTISRVSGEVFGSCMTFGAGKSASAPGQIPANTLKEILDVI